MYRVLPLLGNYKFSTITESSKFSRNSNQKSLIYDLIPEEFLEFFYSYFKLPINFKFRGMMRTVVTNYRDPLDSGDLFPISKSGPGTLLNKGQVSSNPDVLL